MLNMKDARLAVHMSSDAFDSLISSLLDTAVADLAAVGVVEQDDALYDNALRMYLKGHFEPGTEEAEKCRGIYEDIKITMRNTDKYRG